MKPPLLLYHYIVTQLQQVTYTCQSYNIVNMDIIYFVYNIYIYLYVTTDYNSFEKGILPFHFLLFTYHLGRVTRSLGKWEWVEDLGYWNVLPVSRKTISV